MIVGLRAAICQLFTEREARLRSFLFSRALLMPLTIVSDSQPLRPLRSEDSVTQNQTWAIHISLSGKNLACTHR